ncbi:phasin family protein [Collimonas sp.]|jgi:phasin family protein|uniref:phasin family protein n=1 Tax=Collimonas sp. TaxID=1963772 RepID=UPI002D151EFE|nr:phasin family protein [Collimonas sp.]HWW07645.1 phasin family protein [Collimonas sp.]
MSTAAEQFSATAKANFEANLALYTDFTTKAFAGVEKLIDLNLSAAKASLEESAATTQKFFAAKDPQEFFTLSAALAQPNAEKAIAYGRHFASIASSTQAELTKVAEAQVAETKRKVVEFVDRASKNVPPGAEGAVAFVKSAIGSANAGYEQLAKSTKQAVETIESNVNNAVDQLSQAATKGSAHSTKK